MIVKCPKCKQIVQVERRAQGLGTLVDPKTPLSAKENEMMTILEAMSKGHEKIQGEFLGFSVRAIELFIEKNHIKRLPSPESKTKPAPWDSHYIQSTISLLVGRELAVATQLGDRFVYRLNDGASMPSLDNFSK